MFISVSKTQECNLFNIHLLSEMLVFHCPPSLWPYDDVDDDDDDDDSGTY